MVLTYTKILVKDSLLRRKTMDSAGGTYVKPSVTRTGKVRKGYVRRKVNLNKNAVKRQNRSRYNYHTRGKFHRKS